MKVGLELNFGVFLRGQFAEPFLIVELAEIIWEGVGNTGCFSLCGSSWARTVVPSIFPSLCLSQALILFTNI